jgi:hypothetical protein
MVVSHRLEELTRDDVCGCHGYSKDIARSKD